MTGQVVTVSVVIKLTVPDKALLVFPGFPGAVVGKTLAGVVEGLDPAVSGTVEDSFDVITDEVTPVRELSMIEE